MRANRMRLVLSLSSALGMVVLSSPAAGQVASSHGAMPEPPALIHSSAASRLHGTAAAEVCLVDPARELLMTDVSIVDDCYRTTWDGNCSAGASPATRGAWTFGRVAEGIFGTTDPQKLSNRVRQWLNLWMEPHVVNGDLVQARTAMRDLVLRPWEKASQGHRLDMKKAPFRLQAFVVRMDIGDPFFLPEIRSAGEFRLVYNVLDENGEPTPFTVIFEYTMAARSCQDILDYSHAFNKLSSIDLGPEYNAALQTLTDRIITKDAAPGNLNGSALLAVRTNEAFLGSPWELRSFRLERTDPDGGTKNAVLAHQFNELTPAERYQGTQTLADLINLVDDDILSGNFAYPISFRGEPFLAGVSHNPIEYGWFGPPPRCASVENRFARRVFSRFSCQGCHGVDTATEFVHIAPRQPGEASALSPMMTGVAVPDECGVTLRMNDLLRRKNFQCFLLSQSCPSE